MWSHGSKQKTGTKPLHALNVHHSTATAEKNGVATTNFIDSIIRIEMYIIVLIYVEAVWWMDGQRAPIYQIWLALLQCGVRDTAVWH